MHAPRTCCIVLICSSFLILKWPHSSVVSGLKNCMKRGYSYIEGVEELLHALKQNCYEIHAFTNYPIWYNKFFFYIFFNIAFISSEVVIFHLINFVLQVQNDRGQVKNFKIFILDILLMFEWYVN